MMKMIRTKILLAKWFAATTDDAPLSKPELQDLLMDLLDSLRKENLNGQD